MLAAFAAALLGFLHPNPATVKTASAAACSEITVGAVLSLTGERSAAGIQVRNGYEYARHRINRAGGITVDGRCYNLRVIYSDDESSINRAAELTDRLIVRDNMRLLLGPTGLEATEAVAAVATRHQVPVVSIEATPASDLGVPADRRVHFAIDRDPSRYLAALSEFAAQLAPQFGHEPGDLRMALLHDGTRVGAGEHSALTASARRLGIEIVLDRHITGEAGDMSQALAKIKSGRPEIVLLDAHAGLAVRALKMLREMRIDPAILAVADCGSARLLARLGEKAENVLCLAGWGAEVAGQDALFTSPKAFAEDVRKRRRKGAKSPVDPVSAPLAKAAVAVRVLASAIARAGTLDHFQVRDALATTDLDTILGRITFADAQTDLRKSTAVIRQITNGRYVTVWPRSHAKAGYRWPESVQLPF